MAAITLALAKGRTANSTVALLEESGYIFPDMHEDSRKLIFYDETNQVRLIMVKATDVPIYVEKGAADVGVAGKDNILETKADVYELLDLQIGKCQFVVAGQNDVTLDPSQKVVIGSKYPTVAKNYFNKRGIPAETIKLNGSVELAPLIGLADVIVDIMETGSTLKENGLVVLDTINDISTRLIANKASFTTKSRQLHEFMDQLNSQISVT